MPLASSYYRDDLDYNFYYESGEGDDYYYGDEDGYFQVPEDYYDDDDDVEDADDFSNDRMPLSDLSDQCILPTLSQTFDNIRLILVLCLVSKVATSIFKKACISRRLDSWFYITFANVISSVSGVTLLYSFYKENFVFIILLLVVVYPLIRLTQRKCRERTGVIVLLVIVVYLLTCELFIVKKSEWHKIRGSQMILSMKLISLSFDLDTQVLKQAPSILQYSGYALQAGSIIFGPWTSYTDYVSAVSDSNPKLLDFFWVLKCLTSFFVSLGCLVVSTCLSQWALNDVSFMWLAAFRDALSFRFSHYFVCKLSEFLLTLSGFGFSKGLNNEIKWDVTVTKIFNVEMPRSLVEVVTSWNLPMHAWLKNYVFKVSKPLGNFAAIFLTYCASSMLHGLNFQLSAVLLSLGFYTYVEFNLRKKLADCFEACIEAKQCKQNCRHLYKWNDIYVMVTNFSFSLLSVFHLAYLGLMFDGDPSEEEGYSMEHTLSKWSALGYSSHLAAVVTFAVNFII